uniref:Uncharacterized protein n=1 Tax=Anguilla anguilla TaxID=7936 RepID=A0A0E9X6R2_ANGAN
MLWSEGGLFGRLSACRITGGVSFQEKSSSSFNTSHLPQDQNRPLYVILKLFRSLFTLKLKNWAWNSLSNQVYQKLCTVGKHSSVCSLCPE